MSDSERLNRILDAAYACFTRHGIRRTTMDDIAAAAGMSRPAVYQYVRSKDDAYRRLAARLLDGRVAAARAGAAAERDLAGRVTAVCAAKLELTVRIWRDSPHAAELLAMLGQLGADLDAGFVGELHRMLTAFLTDAGQDADTAGRVADLALALTRGLEISPGDLDEPQRRLREGITLLVAGLTATTPPSWRLT